MPPGRPARWPRPNGCPRRWCCCCATGAGLAVASIYYSQPMLGVLGADIGASTRAVGFMPTLTQLGYALGILLLAPLGDRFDRRRIILAKAAVLCAALLLAGAAPGIGWLLVASLRIGLSASMAQDIVPAAATLAPESHRGKVVGMVMTGLLLGILLSRVVSGFVAEHFGWRSMFVVAAASIALVGVAAWRGLPRFRPTTQLAYGALLGSLAALWRRHGALRRATLAQGLLAIGFSAFWSTLAVMLHGAPFHLGSAAAGAFGLAGAAGALAAPLAGRLADRRGPELVTRLGAGLVVLSFAAMALMPLLSTPARLWLLAASAVGFDLGGAGRADRAPDHRLRHRPGGAQPAQRGAVHRHVHRHGDRLGAGGAGAADLGLAGRDRAGDRLRPGGARRPAQRTRAPGAIVGGAALRVSIAKPAAAL